MTGGTITSSGTIAADTTYLQRRVSGTCAVGSSIRTINADGTVVCESDDVGTGTVTSVGTGTGLSGGPITTTGTISVNTTVIQARVTGTCAAGNYVRAIAVDGTVTCGTDVSGAANAFVQNGNAFGATGVLGTTDNFPLDVRVNNARVMRFEPNGITPNVIGGHAANFATAGVRGATVGGGGIPIGDTDPNYPLEGPNRVTDNFGTVGGGYNNQAGDSAGAFGDRPFATVGGGIANIASGETAFVGGGALNLASALYASVAGGISNQATGQWATATGGSSNVATREYSTVGGGGSNQAKGYGSLIAGGAINIGTADYATIGGGFQNLIDGYMGSIFGGREHVIGASAQYATIGGGWANNVGGSYSTIGGGLSNVNGANAGYAVIAGGSYNLADGDHSTIGGGSVNKAHQFKSTVAGGYNNTAGYDYSFVGGGRDNVSSGYGSVVAGGGNNNALGITSQAGGWYANANADGCYVWADFSTSNTISCNAANRYVVRSLGGVFFFAAGSTQATYTGVLLPPGGTSWIAASDRNIKENVVPVEPRDVLERLAAMPIATWNLKAQDRSIRHMGPMAQDFRIAFGLGETDLGINTIDADGVALTAIQGLNAKLEEKVASQAAEIAELRRMVEALAAGTR